MLWEKYRKIRLYFSLAIIDAMLTTKARNVQFLKKRAHAKKCAVSADKFPKANESSSDYWISLKRTLREKESSQPFSWLCDLPRLYRASATLCDRRWICAAFLETIYGNAMESRHVENLSTFAVQGRRRNAGSKTFARYIQALFSILRLHDAVIIYILHGQEA